MDAKVWVDDEPTTTSDDGDGGGIGWLFLCCLGCFVVFLVLAPFIFLPMFWAHNRCELAMEIGTLSLYLVPVLLLLLFLVSGVIGEGKAFVVGVVVSFVGSGCLMFSVVQMWGGGCHVDDPSGEGSFVPVMYVIPGVLLYSLVLCCCPFYLGYKVMSDDGYRSV